MSSRYENVFNALDDHLNDGCVDNGCWWDTQGGSFPTDFIKHLTEVVIEAYEDGDDS